MYFTVKCAIKYHNYDTKRFCTYMVFHCNRGISQSESIVRTIAFAFCSLYGLCIINRKK